jgi:hypothetical protein
MRAFTGKPLVAKVELHGRVERKRFFSLPPRAQFVPTRHPWTATAVMAVWLVGVVFAHEPTIARARAAHRHRLALVDGSRQ